MSRQSVAPAGVFSVLTGSATEIGGELTANPVVRKLTFTAHRTAREHTAHPSPAATRYCAAASSSQSRNAASAVVSALRSGMIR